MISANEELLKQVWINLIDNAVKFSAKSGKIEVGIEEDERNLIVSIINAGEDIPLENQRRKVLYERSKNTKETIDILLLYCPAGHLFI